MAEEILQNLKADQVLTNLALNNTMFLQTEPCINTVDSQSHVIIEYIDYLPLYVYHASIASICNVIQVDFV